MKTYYIINNRTKEILMEVAAESVWKALVAADKEGFNINKVDAIEKEGA